MPKFEIRSALFSLFSHAFVYALNINLITIYHAHVLNALSIYLFFYVLLLWHVEFKDDSVTKTPGE